MKKLLILLALLNGFANAEIIELNCAYTTDKPTYVDGGKKWYGGRLLLTIDPESQRAYAGETKYILEVQPHFYILYHELFFNQNEIILMDKGVYPKNWFYKINRESLSWFGKDKIRPNKNHNGQCTITERKNII